ncbi:uncharacterized protein LOC127768597 isoform X1 [Oryza glaberrima]|uniref:Amino acid permease/ SLC12A domain-containing protein n=1 Tax=Oryza glaberrima TaxID=4538 RepID=I1PBQ0_ORYGL|nr:uncharacterized protein LOC127768597 isoform X1 [Oryza glaberrima]
MSELTMDQEIQLNQRPSPQRQQQAQEHGGATAPAPAPATPQDDEQQGHQAAVARHGCGGATAERHHQTKLTLLPLVFLIYFEVAGGPYGAEQAVSAAGPLFALLGFLAFPFAWGVPVSLVTAEIAAPLPGNGGFVVWADRAFGPLAGSLLGTWKYLSCVINLAAFPALVADYLGRVAPAVAVPGSRARTGTVLGMTVFLSFLNLGGLSTVGWGAVALGFVSLAPFVLMTAMAAPRTRPRRWAARVHVKGKRDWRLFFNTLLWNLNYWDSASTMAGEVERPERTFPRALAVAVVLIAVSYLLPLMAAVGATDAPPEAWENGYLADAAATKLVRNLKGPATSIPLYQNYNSLHHRRAVAQVLDGGRRGALLRRDVRSAAEQRRVPAPRHGGAGPPPLRLRPPRPRTIRHPVGRRRRLRRRLGCRLLPRLRRRRRHRQPALQPRRAARVRRLPPAPREGGEPLLAQAPLPRPAAAPRARRHVPRAVGVPGVRGRRRRVEGLRRRRRAHGPRRRLARRHEGVQVQEVAQVQHRGCRRPSSATTRCSSSSCW